MTNQNSRLKQDSRLALIHSSALSTNKYKAKQLLQPMTTLETNTMEKSPNCVSQVAPPIPPASTFLDDASADDDSTDSNVKVDVSFSHVQLYVDAIEHLDDYKRLEGDVNRLVSQINSYGDVAAKTVRESRK